MGIPKFYSEWLRRRNFPQVLRKGLPANRSSLSLDMNSILHRVAEEVYGYGRGKNKEVVLRDPNQRTVTRLEYIRSLPVNQRDDILFEEYCAALSTTLFRILSKVHPKDVLVLAIDGVAPHAKIQQQRQRRYRGALDQPEFFNRTAITPGTDFMIKLDDYLRNQWLVRNRQRLPTRVIYSGHLVPGEGEHKIMDLVRAGEVTGDGAHVFHGMDADLIMLTLLLPLDQVFLMREDIRDVVDIAVLRTAIQGEMVASPTVPLSIQQAVQDFVVMGFLIGNDFLPSTPALNAGLGMVLDTFLGVYRALGKPLTSGGDLVWSNLAEFFSVISYYEPYFLAAMADVPSTGRNPVMRSKFLDAAIVETARGRELHHDIFRNGWYHNALGPHDPAMVMLFNTLGLPVPGPSVKRIEGMVLEYLTGMAWIYGYYRDGVRSVSTSYLYPYLHSPLLIDMARGFPTAPPTRHREGAGSPFLNPVLQLLAVVPPASIDLLPAEVRWLIDSEQTPVPDLYPSEVLLERDGRLKNEPLVWLPPLQIDRLNIAAKYVPPELLESLEPTQNIIDAPDADMVELIQAKESFYRKRDYHLQQSQRPPHPRDTRHSRNRGGKPSWRSGALFR